MLSVFLRGIPKADLNPAPEAPDPKMKATIKAAAKAAVAGSPAKAIHTTPVAVQSGADQYGTIGRVRGSFIVSRTWSLIAVYFFVCYATVIVSYYTPFLMQADGLGDSDVGTVTAIFFLAVFLPGFVLPYIIKVLRQWTPFRHHVSGLGARRIRLRSVPAADL